MTAFPNRPDLDAVRRRLERIIERAVDLLDTLDGDPDLEPYLAGQPYGDLEMDDSDLEEEPDGEPWLGAPEDRESQIGWAAGGMMDLEEEWP